MIGSFRNDAASMQVITGDVDMIADIEPISLVLMTKEKVNAAQVAQRVAPTIHRTPLVVNAVLTLVVLYQR